MTNAFEEIGGTVETLRYAPTTRPPLHTRGFDIIFTDYINHISKSCPQNEAFDQILEAMQKSELDIRENVRLGQLSENIALAVGDRIESGKPTAVITFNDIAAFECASLLRARGKRLPEDISLVSFDDTIKASLADITSYNFNETKILASMLDWVLWPQRKKARSIVSAPQGFITQRRSVRTAG